MTTTEQNESGRLMGYNERLQLSATNAGRPATLAFLASLPASAQHSITESVLLEAIAHLLELYPLLRCAVVDGRTRTPSWKAQPSLEATRVLDMRSDLGGSDEALLAELVNLGNTFDGSHGPLWKVIWYKGDSPRLALAIAHTLSDGLGARNLFCDLLRLLRAPGAELVSSPHQGKLAPSWDSTVDLHLRPLVVARVLWAMAVFALWSVFYPTKRVVPSQGPFDDSPTRVWLVRLSSEQTAALKAFAKQNGIRTLHPLLHGAVLTSAFLANEERFSRGAINEMTAVNFRDSSLGHPRASGGYSGAHFSTLVLYSTQLFIELCESYARKLAEPKTRTMARDTIGMLQLMGDPDPTQHTFALEGKVYPRSNLEKYRLDVASGKMPIAIDVGTSNLMRMDATGWEGEEGWRLAAAQTAGVSYAPLLVTPLSAHSGGMSISVSWKKGTEEGIEYAERFVGLLGSVLGRVARGEVDERATIESLRQQ